MCSQDNQPKRLTFSYAEADTVQINCTDYQSASEDWLKRIMSRHKKLAVRKPESTSVSRTTSLIKESNHVF